MMETTKHVLPKVSVVIPAYNAADTIVSTLDTVVGQTLPPDEIIVVDDGSTDQTCQVVCDFGHNVRLIQQENGGPAKARNHGVREATHQWVAFIDADDSWMPQKLEFQLPHCREDVGLIHCYEEQEAFEFRGERLDFETLWTHNYIGTSTVVLNRQAFNEVGGFNEDRNLTCVEDFNLWLRIAAASYEIVTVRKPLIRYTPAEGNLSSNFERVIQAELLNIEYMAEQLDLPDAMIRQRQTSLYEEYAKAFFWKRNLRQARGYYGQLLKNRPSVTTLAYWFATFLPVALLGKSNA